MSHVLKAIGLTEEEAQRSLRISFGRSNSLDDAKYAASILARTVNGFSRSANSAPPAAI
jgi:cysteine sulfinate desulfinase/cysteine desulfurase-like protein